MGCIRRVKGLVPDSQANDPEANRERSSGPMPQGIASSDTSPGLSDECPHMRTWIAGAHPPLRFPRDHRPQFILVISCFSQPPPPGRGQEVFLMSSETLCKGLSPLTHHTSHLPSQNPVGLDLYCSCATSLLRKKLYLKASFLIAILLRRRQQ